jgi:hypothetical protein
MSALRSNSSASKCPESSIGWQCGGTWRSRKAVDGSRQQSIEQPRLELASGERMRGGQSFACGGSQRHRTMQKEYGKKRIGTLDLFAKNMREVKWTLPK